MSEINGCVAAQAAPLSGPVREPVTVALDEVQLAALFRSVVVQANDVVLVTEAEPVDLPSGGPRVVYVNPAFTRMTGYAYEDIVGLTPRLLQSPRTDQTELAKIRVALPRWQPVEVELLNVRKDGTEFWVQINITPAADERGWFTHWIAIQRDVTERKHQEQAVQAMLEGSSDLMLLLDAASLILTASPSCTSLLGRSPAELVGLDVNELFHPADRLLADEVLFPGDGLRLGPHVQADVRMLDAFDAWRWMQLSAVELPAQAPGTLLISCVDVSELRRSEAQLADLNDKFRSAFQDAPTGMALTDPQGRILQVNSALTQLLARPETELLQRRLTELQPAQELSSVGLPSRSSEGPRRRYRQEMQLLHPDGGAIEVLRSSSAVAGTDGQTMFSIEHIEDISERKIFQAQLQHQVLHDTLTGLANRVLLTDRIEQALLHRSGQVEDTLAVLFLDLDRFKAINDSLGHPIGDTVLQHVADRLRAIVRSSDTVARFGGDEFVILSMNCGPEEAADTAGRIQRALAAPLPPPLAHVRLSASIGVALSHPETSTAATLIRDADAAMYAAKTQGSNRVEVFDEDLGARVRDRLQLETELRSAITTGQLRLQYQPIQNLADNHIVGTEALVRWAHPTRGLLPPGTFVELAEESDLILALGRWVLQEAITAAARAGAAPDAPMMWVNLSVHQLRDPSLLATIEELLHEHQLPGAALGLEITESVLIHDHHGTLDTLQAIRAMGIALAIDDFGTGYSSLSYLAQFPVDAVKIDRSFTAGLDCDSTRRESYAIISAVVGLAHALHLDVIAEGIETRTQVQALQGLGVEYGQGYLLGRPAPERPQPNPAEPFH